MRTKLTLLGLVAGAIVVMAGPPASASVSSPLTVTSGGAPLIGQCYSIYPGTIGGAQGDSVGDFCMVNATGTIPLTLPDGGNYVLHETHVPTYFADTMTPEAFFVPHADVQFRGGDPVDVSYEVGGAIFVTRSAAESGASLNGGCVDVKDARLAIVTPVYPWPEGPSYAYQCDGLDGSYDGLLRFVVPIGPFFPIDAIAPTERAVADHGEPVPVGLRSNHYVNFVNPLRPLVDHTFHVVDGDTSQPVLASACVSIYDHETVFMSSCQNAQGDVRFTGVRSGTFDVSLYSLPGYLPFEDVTLPIDGTHTETTLLVHRIPPLHIRVLAAAGGPVVLGACLDLYRIDDDDGRIRYRDHTARCDGDDGTVDGIVTLVAPRPGFDYRAVVAADEPSPSNDPHLDIPAGTTEIDFVVGPIVPDADTTAPTHVVDGLVDGGHYTPASAPNPSCRLVDDGSGPGSPSTTIHNLPFNEPGTHHVTCTGGTDLAGNPPLADRTYTYEVANPGAPQVLGTRDRSPNSRGWYNAPVTVTWDAIDDEDDLVDPAPSTTSAEGALAAAFSTQVCDHHGLCAYGTDVMSIDLTPPVVHIDGPADGAAYGQGAVPEPVCVTEDELSGVYAEAFMLPIDVQSPGVYTVSCLFGSDNAGNFAVPVSITFTVLDTIAPTVTATVQTGTEGSGGWFTTPMVVSIDGIDEPGGSGIADVSVAVYRDGAFWASGTFPGSVPVSLEAGDGTWTISASAADLAGNHSGTSLFTYLIDSAPPTIEAAYAPDVKADHWTNAAQTVVTFTCNDELSGISWCPDPVTLGNGSEGYFSQVTSAIDVAGNASTAHPAAFVRVDLTAPVVSVTGVANGATYAPGSVPVAGCSATDNWQHLGSLPRVPLLTVTGATPTAVGQHTATCEVSDAAGNSATASVTYTVAAATPTGSVFVHVDFVPNRPRNVTGCASLSVGATVVRSACDAADGSIDGVVRFTGVPVGSYTATASTSRPLAAAWIRPAPTAVSVQAGATTDVTLTFRITHRITIRTERANGKAVGGGVCYTLTPQFSDAAPVGPVCDAGGANAISVRVPAGVWVVAQTTPPAGLRPAPSQRVDVTQRNAWLVFVSR